MKFTKNQQGAIAVFLSIILLMMFVFSAVIVDGGRIYAGRNIVSGAGQLALNSGLATYDEALKDAYGLIAMSEDVEDLEKNLNEYFVASLGACGITEEQYNTALVFLEMAAQEGSFDAKAVPNTEVCRGYVMEQQVLDYMKYRAPITVGKDIFDKLKNSKEMKLVKTVANDELETAKVANDIQKLLEDLKSLVDQENISYRVMEDAFKTSGTFDTMKKDAQIVTAGQLLLEDYDKYEGTAGVEGDDWEEKINNFIEVKDKAILALAKTDKLDAYIDAYDHMILSKSYINDLKDVTKDEFIEFWKKKYQIDETDDDSEEDDDETGGTTENNSTTDTDAELLLMGEQLYGDYESAKQALDNAILAIGGNSGEITKRLQEIEKESVKIEKAVNTGERTTEKIKTKIEKIRKKLEDMESKLKTWKDDSSTLSDENLRNSNAENQKQYENLVDGDIDKLYNAAEKNRLFYKEFKEYFVATLEKPGAEFANTAMTFASTNSWVLRLEIATHAESVSSSTELKNFVYDKTATAFCLLYTMHDVKLKFNFEESTKNLKKLKFYEFLEEVCGKGKKEQEIKDANSDLNEELSGLLKELEKMMTSSDLDDIKGKLAEQNENLPTTLLGAGGAQSKNLDDETNKDKNKINLDKNGKRKNTLNNATGTLNKDNTMLDGIVNLASKGIEEIVEPVYITEYFLTMYSYYTVDKTGKKENNKWGEKDAEEIVSLSNYDLTQDLIYRAEAEYILWGNKNDARTNVNTTKAVIFAIQFVGNLTYALTQKNVTDGAKFIGNLFPNKIVSVVVQVVVEVVVATVETVRDMVVLCNGGAVVPFKIMAQEEWRSDFNSPDDIAEWDMTKDNTSDNLLAFTYRDYLWIMLCIGCISNSTRYTMLERAADLSQVNLAKSEEDAEFKLMDKNTMLQIDANVEMETWLVTDIFKNNGLDTGGKYTLKYKGIQGY